MADKGPSEEGADDVWGDEEEADGIFDFDLSTVAAPPEKHSVSLYGPTQLVSLLNKTAGEHETPDCGTKEPGTGGGEQVQKQ